MRRCDQPGEQPKTEAYKEADRDRKIESLIKNMKGVCDNTLGNMLFLKDNYEMARRTMIVRYEDVAVEPFTYAAVSHVIFSQSHDILPRHVRFEFLIFSGF